MAEPRRAQKPATRDLEGARAVIVEARFYDDILDSLLEGAVKELDAAGVGPPPSVQVDFESGALPGAHVDAQYASRGVFFGASTAPYTIQNADCGPNYGLPTLVGILGAGHSGARSASTTRPTPARTRSTTCAGTTSTDSSSRPPS